MVLISDLATIIYAECKVSNRDAATKASLTPAQGWYHFQGLLSKDGWQVLGMGSGR